MQINKNETNLYLQMVLPNLTTNTIYEVKVRAASISTINPRQIILGSYSEPRKVNTFFTDIYTQL